MSLLRCAVLSLLCMSLAGSVAGAGTGKPGPTLRPQPFVPTPGFGAQPQRLMLPFSGPVAIVATPSPERELRLWEGERLHRLDRRAFSEAMAALLRGSVEASGAAVVPQGKTIAVEVVHVDFLYKGPCLVDTTVRLGNGLAFGVQGQGGKPARVGCREAFEDSIRLILGNPRTADYLGGS